MPHPPEPVNAALGIGRGAGADLAIQEGWWVSSWARIIGVHSDEHVKPLRDGWIGFAFPR